MPPVPLLTVELPPNQIIESVMHVIVEERPYYRDHNNGDLRDRAIKLIWAIMEHDRARAIFHMQGTDRSRFTTLRMDHDVLLETVRWTIKDGYAIVLPYFDAASLEVSDNTTVAGVAMSTQKMAKPTVDVQSETSKELAKKGHRVKGRGNYKCKRCGRPKKNHVCVYDAAGDLIELATSISDKVGNVSGSNDGRSAESKRYVMMLDAWSDQGYQILPDTGEQNVIENAETTLDEAQGAIAAEILRGMNDSKERCIQVSEEAIAAIDDGGKIPPNEMEHISASDLEPQEERELYVSEQGLQRILQEQARQEAVEQELARLGNVACIDPNAPIETSEDGLVNQEIDDDDPRNSMVRACDCDKATTIFTSLQLPHLHGQCDSELPMMSSLLISLWVA